MSARKTFAQVARGLLSRDGKLLQINTTTSTTIRTGTRWASEIMPRLYLSDVTTATNVEELDRLKVTHILTVMEQPVSCFATSRGIEKRTLLHIPIADIHSADLLQHLDQTTSFIQEALKDKDSVVLVCHWLYM